MININLNNLEELIWVYACCQSLTFSIKSLVYKLYFRNFDIEAFIALVCIYIFELIFDIKDGYRLNRNYLFI